MEVKSSWNTGFGKLASRSAQTLLILLLTGVIVFGLVQLKLVVIPLVLAIILAAALSPLVAYLQKMKLNRSAASILTMLTSLGLFGVVGSFIFNTVKSEWSSHSSTLSDKLDAAVEWLHSGALPVSGQQIDEFIVSLKEYLTSPSFGQGALQFSGTLTSALTGLFLTLVILFFFLKDGKEIFAFLLRFMKIEDHKTKADRAGGVAVTALGGYVRGTMLVALVDAVLIGVGLTATGVPLVIPLCLLVFIGAFIPFIGSISAGLIITLIALLTTNLDTAIIVAIIVLAVNQIEGLFSPFILGSILKINALAILLAVTVGGILGGIVGAVLSVPIVSVAWLVWTTWNEPEQKIQEETPDDSEIEGSEA
jgi:predicted PurR-regulated permease PerM